MREKAIEALRKEGFDAGEENGVLMIYYHGTSQKEADKMFKEGKKVAAAAGYNASIGIRGKKEDDVKNNVQV